MYIPSFKNPQVLESYDQKTQQYQTRPANSEITIRHLLSHTAGISYSNPLEGHPAFPALNFLPAVTNQTLAQTIPLLGKRPLIADPGKKFVYGPNTDVLGYLLNLSGRVSQILQDEDFTMRMSTLFYYRRIKLRDWSVVLLEIRGSIAIASDAVSNYPLTKKGTYYLVVPV